MNPLVSIITPCYNGERYLDAYFRSILGQTYDNYELIFVNDGSEDLTEKIVDSYRKEFEERGINFTYIYQKNAGQAAALNAGFPYMKGKYLIWPDADDTMDPDSISKRVVFLENHPDFGFVRSSGDFIDDETKKRKGSVDFSHYNSASATDIFLDLINEQTYCVPGCYMIRTEVLRDIYPDLRIYESSAGQNWQILIPIAGRTKCGYINEELYHVFVHKDSHSRKKRSVDEQANRLLELKKVLLIGVENSKRQDRDYRHIIDVKYNHLLFQLYLSSEDKEKAKEYFQALRSDNELTEGEIRPYLKKWYPVRFFLHRVKYRITHLKK